MAAVTTIWRVGIEREGPGRDLGETEAFACDSAELAVSRWAELHFVGLVDDFWSQFVDVNHDGSRFQCTDWNGDTLVAEKVDPTEQQERLLGFFGRDALANAMCRHALISDWFEKADAVLTTLAEQGFTLTRTA